MTEQRRSGDDIVLDPERRALLTGLALVHGCQKN